MRSRRRFTSSTAPEVEDPSSLRSPENVEYSTIRSRSSRRRDENTQKDNLRTRTRSRPIISDTNIDNNSRQFSSLQNERNERYSNSRNTQIRTRKRPIARKEAEVDTDNISNKNASSSRGRQRSNYRPSSRPLTDTTAPATAESKLELVSASLDETTKRMLIENQPSTIQFRPRGRSITSTKSFETTTARRVRGRVIKKVKSSPENKTLEPEVNTDGMTEQASEDVRIAKKLHYKTRLSETDTNLTGQGIIAANIVNKSSQKESITSQEEINTANKDIQEELQSSTSNIIVTSTSTTSIPVSSIQGSIVRRPLSRGKSNFRSTVTLPKPKKDTIEISEDDNYPESFKALLQAKNAAVSTIK